MEESRELSEAPDAPAYSGLSDTYRLTSLEGVAPPRDCMPKAEAAARKAREFDDTLAEAHTSLANVLYRPSRTPMSLWASTFHLYNRRVREALQDPALANDAPGHRLPAYSNGPLCPEEELAKRYNRRMRTAAPI